jgi:phenylalanyl-tRNA synthetase alpha chain
MVLFSIPDIRLFWSEDKRFLNQFADGGITTFKPYSKYPPCYRDMSFWIPDAPVTDGGSAAGGLNAEHGVVTQGWHENDYCEIVREVAGDLVETVEKVCSCYAFRGEQPADGPRSTSLRIQSLARRARRSD